MNDAGARRAPQAMDAARPLLRAERRQGWRTDARVRWGGGVLVLFSVAAIVLPMLGTTDPTAIGDVLATRLVPPFGTDSHGTFHLLGTDAFGRDVLARLWVAARISLGVGIAGSLLA